MSYLNEDAKTNPILAKMQADMNTPLSSDQTDDLPGNPSTKQDLWEQTYGKEFYNTSQVSIGDVPDDLGEYTRLGVEYNPYQPDVSREERALNQSYGEQIVNAGKRYVASALVETVNTAGGIGTLFDFMNEEDEIGNAITKWAERSREGIDEWAPIYLRTNEQRNKYTNPAWWLKNGSDLAASVTAFGATGGVIGRGLSSIKWLDKLTKGYRGAKRGKDLASAAADSQIGAGSKLLSANTIDNIAKGQRVANSLITSTALNQAESIMSASQVYGDVYDDMIRKGYSDSAAKELASNAASYTVNVNRANILLNMTSATRFLKTPDALKSSLRVQKNGLRDIFTRTEGAKQVDNVWRDMGLEAIQESTEELINVYSETRGKEYARNLLTNPDEARKSHLKAIFDPLRVDKLAQTAATEEGIEAMVLGAIGGIGQTGIQKGVIDEYVGGKMFGERVAKIDSQGKVVRSKKDATYDKDTPYEIGERIHQDITDNEGNIIAEAGTVVDEELVAKHRDKLIHKEGDLVRDNQGNTIQIDGDVEYEQDGAYMSVNKARRLKAEQAESIMSRMKSLANETIKVEGRSRYHQKQYAAVEAVDNILDPQVNEKETDDFYEVLARWELNGEEEKIDFDTEEGQNTLSERKESLKGMSFLELQEKKNKAKANLVQEQAWQAFENGNKDSLKSIYKDIANYDEDAAREAGFDEDYKEQAESVLNQIDKLYSYYREYTAKYNPQRAKALYELASKNLHNEKLNESYKKEKQRVIAENELLADDTQEYMSTLEGVQKAEAINKKEQEELKEPLSELKELNDKIAYLESNERNAEISEDEGELETDRDYINKLAAKRAKDVKEISNLKNQYDQKQAEIDNIRSKYADQRIQEGVASRADIDALVDLNRSIRRVEDEIARNNKEFIRVRDRKKDPKTKVMRISERNRQREMFRQLGNQFFQMQEDGSHVITYNPNKTVRPIDKYVSSVLARLAKVSKETPGIKGKIDQAIQEYKNLLNDYELAEFTENENLIRQEIIEKINQLNNTSDSQERLSAMESLLSTGLTGKLQPTNNEYVFEFIPNYNELVYIDESEVDYYRNATFPGTDKKMYNVEEVSTGLYKATITDNAEAIELTYDDLYRINAITTQQASVKDVLDTHINLSRSRVARINALEQLKIKKLDEVSKKLKESTDELKGRLEVNIESDLDEIERIKKEYVDKFGELNDNLSPNQMRELNRLEDLRVKLIKEGNPSELVLTEEYKEILTDELDQLNEQFDKVEDELDLLLEELQYQEFDIEGQLEDDQFNVSSEISRSTQSIGELESKIDSLSSIRDNIIDRVNYLSKIVETSPEMNKEVKLRVDYLNTEKEVLESRLSNLRDVKKSLASYRTEINNATSDTQKEEVNRIFKDLRGKYSELYKRFNGYYPPSKDIMSYYSLAADGFTSLLDMLGDIDGTVTHTNTDVRNLVQSIVDGINYVEDNVLDKQQIEKELVEQINTKKEALKYLRLTRRTDKAKSVKEAKQTLIDSAQRIRELKSMQSEQRFVQSLMPISNRIKSLNNALKEAQESEDTLVIDIADNKTKLAKALKVMNATSKFFKQNIDLVNDFTNDMNYLFNTSIEVESETVRRKIKDNRKIKNSIDKYRSTKEQYIFNKLEENSSKMDEAKRQLDLFFTEEISNDFSSKMQAVIDNPASNQLLYLTHRYLNDPEIATDMSEDIYNTRYGTIKESIALGQRYDEQLRELVNDLQSEVNMLENQINMIDKVKDNINLLSQAYGDKESDQVQLELQQLAQNIYNELSTLEDVQRAVNVVDNHSNLIDQIDTTIDQILNETNIRSLYSEEELEAWEESGDIDDLPGDPYIRLIEALPEDLEFDENTSYEQLLSLKEGIENTIEESNTVLQILQEAYSDIDDLIETEASIDASKDQESLDDLYRQQRQDQRGADATGEKNEDPIDPPQDTDIEFFERKYNEAETILKRRSVLTDAGAHLNYEIKYKDGEPYIDNQFDKDGNPVFVNNPMMIGWKTLISRIGTGMITDDNGNQLTPENTAIRFINPEDDLISNIKATSNALSANSNGELISRGLGVNEDGEIYVANKSRYDSFIEGYVNRKFAGNEKANKIIPEEIANRIKNKNTSKTFTVSELDLLFRYAPNLQYGSEVISDGTNTERVKGPGIYIVVSDKEGNPLYVDLDNNKAGTKNVNNNTLYISTINTPYSSDKVQFKNNLATFIAENMNFDTSMTLDELVTVLMDSQDTKDVSKLTASFKDADGNEISVNLEEVLKMKDTLIRSQQDDSNGLKEIVRNRIEKDINEFRNTAINIKKAHDNNKAILTQSYSVSNGHPLLSKNTRSVNDIYTKDQIKEVVVNTTKKAATEKIRNAYGEPVSFSEENTPTPKTKTGQVLLLNNNNEYIPVKPRKINSDEADLLLKLITEDFGNHIQNIDGKFKTSNRVVDENGNEIKLPNQGLIRFESKKNMTSDELPIVSKLVFFSGKDPNSNDYRPWDMTVERSNKQKYGNKNYLHYGDNEVAVSTLREQLKEGSERTNAVDDFKEWAMQNLTLMVSNKSAMEKVDEPYYHPIDLQYDENIQSYTTVVRKYDSYLDYLFKNNVLETNVLSPSESEALGGKGETNVGKYVQFDRNVESVVQPNVNKIQQQEQTPTSKPQETTEENIDKPLSEQNINDIKAGTEIELEYDINIPSGTIRVSTVATIMSDSYKNIKLNYLSPDRSKTRIYQKPKGSDTFIENKENFDIFYEAMVKDISNVDLLKSLLDGNPLEVSLSDIERHMISSITYAITENDNKITLSEFFNKQSKVLSSQGKSTAFVSAKPYVETEEDTDTEVDVPVIDETPDTEQEESEQPRFSNISNAGEFADEISIAKTKIELLDKISPKWKDIEVTYTTGSPYPAKVIRLPDNKLRIVIDESINSNNYSDAKKADILIHEIVHIETADKIQAYRNRPSGTPGNISEALDAIDEIRGLALDHLIRNVSIDSLFNNNGSPKSTNVILLGYNIKNSELAKAYKNTLKELKARSVKSDDPITFDDFIKELSVQSNNNPLVDNIKTDINEFVASIFENRKFIETLNDIEVESDIKGVKTLYDRIINAVRVMLGLDIKSNSALKKGLEATLIIAKSETITPVEQQEEVDDNVSEADLNEGTYETDSDVSSDEIDLSVLEEDTDSIIGDSGDDLAYPVDDENKDDISEKYGDKINNIVKYFTEQQEPSSIRDIINDLNYDYDNLSTTLILNALRTGDNLNQDNIDRFIYDKVFSYIESLNDGSNSEFTGDNADIFDLVLRNVYESLGEINNYKKLRVKPITSSQNVLQVKELADKFTKHSDLHLNDDMSLSKSEQIDFYDSLSYFLFNEIISSKLDFSSAPSTKTMEELYKKSLLKTATYIGNNADKLLKKKSTNPGVKKLADRVYNISDVILKGVNSNFSEGMDLQGFRDLLNNHFQSVMVSYGYHQIQDENEEISEDNLLSAIPDYVDKSLIDPKTMMPALIKIIVAGTPEAKIKESVIDQNRLGKLKNIESFLANAEDRVEENVNISDKDRKILSEIGKMYKIPYSVKLTNSSGKLNSTDKEIAKSIISNALPEIRQKLSTGSEIKVINKNNMMLGPSLSNFGRVWNYMSRQLSNNPPEHSSLLSSLKNITSNEKTKALDRGIFGLNHIAKALNNFSNHFNAGDISVLNSLLQSLTKYEMAHSIVIVDSAGNIYPTSANISNKKRNIKSNWKNSLVKSVSDFNRDINKSGSDVTKSFIQSLNRKIKEGDKTQAAFNTLRDLGITFNDEKQVLKILKSKYKINDINNYVQDMISWMDNIEGKEPELLFSSKEDIISGKISVLVDAEIESDTDIVTNQFINATGETVYSLQLYHTLTLLNTRLNDLSGKPSLIKQKLPFYNDPYAQNSKLLQHVKSGGKITTGVANGIRYNISGEQGKETQSLSFSDQLTLRIHEVLNGNFLIPQAADRKIFNTVGIGNNRLLYNNPSEVKEAFTNYLLDELRVMNNYTNDSNYNELVKGSKGEKRSTEYRFFDEIIKDEALRQRLKQLFVKGMNSNNVPKNLYELSQYDKNNETALAKQIQSEIEKFFNQKVKDVKDVLAANGVSERTPMIKGAKGRFYDKLTIDEKKKISTPIFQGISKSMYAEYSNDGKKSSSDTLDSLLYDYLTNQIGFYIEFTKLYSGDPVFYGTEDSFFKRMSMVNSTRKIAAVGESIDNTLRRYDYNKIVNENGEVSKMTVSDFMDYVNGDLDIGDSRIIMGSGFRLDRKKHNSKFNSITFNDVELPSQYAQDDVAYIKIENDQVRYFNKDNSEVKPSLYRKIFTEGLIKSGFKDPSVVNLKATALLKPYTEINEADGQGYITLDEYRELLIRVGDWTNKHEDIFLKLLRGDEITKEELYYYQPLKTQYMGPMGRESENLKNVFVPMGYKHSIIPLIPSVIKGTQLEKLNNWMIKNQVGLAQFASANKFGTKRDSNGNINNFYREDGDNLIINDDNWNKDLIQESEYEYFSIQVDNKPKLKEKVTSGSQKRKLNLIDVFNYGKASNDKLSTVAKEYVDLQNYITTKKMNDLKRQIGVTGSKEKGYTIKNYSKLIDILLDQARSREADDNVINAIQMLNAKIDRPNIFKNKKKGLFIEELGDIATMESVLMAIVRSRAIHEKRPGESYPQAASTGFEKKRIKSSNDLKYYREDVRTDNLIPAQVKLPLRPDMINYVNSIGGLSKFNKTIKDLHKKLDKIREKGEDLQLTDDEANLHRILTIIGFRIPTQQLGSIGVYEVAEFLPPEVGNTAIVPPEIVAQMGSDFDFDKFVVEYPSIIMSSEGIKYLDNNNIDYLAEYYKYMSKDLSRDKSMMRSVEKNLRDEMNREYYKGVVSSLKDYFEDIDQESINLIEGEQQINLDEDIQEYNKELSKLFGISIDSFNQLLEDIDNSDNLSFSKVKSSLIRSGNRLSITPDVMIEYLAAEGNSMSDISELKKSMLYSAYVKAGGESFDDFKVKLNSKQKFGYVSSGYMYNRMIELQKELLTDKDRKHVILSPVSDDDLIGDKGVVWMIRMLKDNSKWAKNIRDNYYKEVKGVKDKSKKDDIKFKYVREYKSRFKTEQDRKSLSVIIDPIANIDKAQAFLIGKKNIGIAARQITNHTLTQAANAAMNLPLTLTENGTFEDNANLMFDFNLVDEKGNPLNVKRSHLFSSKNKVYKEGSFIGIKDNEGNIIIKPGEKVYPALGSNQTINNQNILQTLSAFLNAYVDVAKDPYIFDINAGADTVNVYMYLLRTGVDLETATMLINQPSVVEYVKQKQQYNSNFKKAYGIIPSKKAIVLNVLSKYMPSQYPSLMNVDEWFNATKEEKIDAYVALGEKRSIYEQAKEDSSVFMDYYRYLKEYEDFAVTVPMMYARKQQSTDRVENEDLHKMPYKQGRNALWFASEDVGNYKYISNDDLADNISGVNVKGDIQKQALDMFLEYERQSGLLLDVMNATSQDTYGTSKSYTDTYNYVNESKNTHNKGHVIRSKDMIEKTIVKGFNEAIEETLAIFKPLYFTRSIASVEETLDAVKEISGNHIKGAKSKEKFNRFVDDEFITFLLHSDFGDENYIDSKDVYDRLVKGTNSRYKDDQDNIVPLTTFVSMVNNGTFKDNKSQELRNNAFFRKLSTIGSSEELESVVDDNEPRFSAGKKDSLALVFQVANLTKPERDKIINDFRKIKNIDRDLYYDLIQLGLAQYGVYKSPYSYVDIIPFEDKAILISHKVNQLAQRPDYVVDKYMDVFVEQFYSTYRIARFLPRSTSTKHPNNAENYIGFDGMPMRFPFINIPVSNAPFAVVKYTQDNEGNSYRQIHTGPVRASGGTVYTRAIDIKGSNNWSGYGMKVTEDFVTEAREYYEANVLNSEIQKSTDLSRQINVELSEDIKEGIELGIVDNIYHNPSISKNLEVNDTITIVSNNKPYHLVYKGNVTASSVGGSNKAMELLGYNHLDEVQKISHKQWILGNSELSMFEVQYGNDANQFFLYDSYTSKEPTPTELGIETIKSFINNNELQISYIKIPDNLSSDGIDNYLNNTDELEVVSLTADNLEDYYNTKGKLQNIYGRNTSLAIDESTGKYIPNLYKYLDANYGMKPVVKDTRKEEQANFPTEESSYTDQFRDMQFEENQRNPQVDDYLTKQISASNDAIKFNSKSGNTKWLSNFEMLVNPIVDDNNNKYYSVEAYYQAMKTTNLKQRKAFTGVNVSGRQAKSMGKTVILRPNWDNIKFSIMRNAINQKFDNNPTLVKKLKETGNAQLVEWNSWGDKTWGITSKDNKGANALGKIIQEYRDKEFVQKQFIVKPTVDNNNNWNDLKTTPVYSDKGVNTMRTKNKEADYMHFGNPFSSTGVNNTIKVKDVPTAIKMYKDWIVGNEYPFVEPKQRQWILDQINSGKLDEATLLYDKKLSDRKLGSHAEALRDIIVDLRSNITLGYPTDITNEAENIIASWKEDSKECN